MPGWEQDVTSELTGELNEVDRFLVRDKSDTTDSADGTDKDGQAGHLARELLQLSWGDTVVVDGDASTRSTRATAVQDAINKAENDGKSFVFVPHKFGPGTNGYDASAITFTGSGGTFAGQLIREGQTKDWYDVQAYGAAGDGVEDDAAAFQAAVDAPADPGGTAYFPEGTYKITSSISCRKATNLIGAGAAADDDDETTGVTFIDAQVGANIAFDFTAKRNFNYVGYFRLYGQSDAGSEGFRFRSSSVGAYLEHLVVKKFGKNCVITDTQNAMLHHCQMTQAEVYDVLFDNTSAADIIGGGYGGGTPDASIRIETNADGIRIEPAQIDDTGGSGIGIDIQGGSGNVTDNIHVKPVRLFTEHIGVRVSTNTKRCLVDPGVIRTRGVNITDAVQINGGDDHRVTNFPREKGVGATITDNGTRTRIAGTGKESANAEEPQDSDWQVGDKVEFTDTGDGSGSGLYQLARDGVTWQQLD